MDFKGQEIWRRDREPPALPRGTVEGVAVSCGRGKAALGHTRPCAAQ